MLCSAGGFTASIVSLASGLAAALSSIFPPNRVVPSAGLPPNKEGALVVGVEANNELPSAGFPPNREGAALVSCPPKSDGFSTKVVFGASSVLA